MSQVSFKDTICPVTCRFWTIFPTGQTQEKIHELNFRILDNRGNFSGAQVPRNIVLSDYVLLVFSVP